ncbi:MAG: glycosyltransferase family 9 protein [Candidatus Saganbacteria bacterium]|nr:glycosyltransferase family 9 protein [Candidatus Saganbacteria bacterium]
MNKNILKPIKKILIIRPDAIGDVVLITPALSALKKRFPEAKLTLLIQKYTEDVVKGNPDIDAIIIDDIKAGKVNNVFEYFGYVNRIKSQKFDLCVNYYNDTPAYAYLPFLAGIPYRIADKSRILSSWLSNLGTFLNHLDPNKHVVERNLDLIMPLGIDRSNPKLILPIQKESENKVAALLESLNISKEQLLIGIHIGTGGSNKAWRADGYAKVIDTLSEQYNAKIILIGSGKEEKTAIEIISLCKHKPISLVNKLTLAELIALISYLKLFIGVDSGPMHIAAALKIPVVAIFATKKIKPSEWGPWQTQNVIIRKESACKRSCDPRTCIYDDCLKEINPEDIIQGVKTLKC